MKSDSSVLKRAALLSIFFLAGCAAALGLVGQHGPKPDGHYDNHAYLVDSSRMDLGRVMASFVTLQTKTTFETLEGEVVEHLKEGSDVILGGRFVLTVEHVVAQHDLTVITPIGVVEVLVKKVPEETSFRWKGKSYPLRPVYKNREEDIALLEIPSGVHPSSFPYPLGDSNDLRVGNFVYVIGNPLSLGVNVREGIVSALQAPRQASAIGVKPMHAFMVSNGLSPGDSGSPIIAIRDGRFELVGISQGTVSTNTRLSWGIRINLIRNLIRTARAVPPDRWAILKKVELTLSENQNETHGTGFFSQTGRYADRLIGDLITLRPILGPLDIAPKQEGTP